MGENTSAITPVRVTTQLRDVPNSTLHIDAWSHMTSGPGRYIRPNLFDGVRSLLRETRLTPGQTYTLAQLQALDPTRYSSAAFASSVTQYNIDPNSTDFGSRAYIYGSESYRATFSSVSIVNGKIEIQGLQVAPFADNFNYESSNGFARAVNPALRVAFQRGDPASWKVDLVYDNTGAVPIFSNYDAADLAADDNSWQRVYAPDTAANFLVNPSVAGVGLDLGASHLWLTPPAWRRQAQELLAGVRNDRERERREAARDFQDWMNGRWRPMAGSGDDLRTYGLFWNVVKRSPAPVVSILSPTSVVERLADRTFKVTSTFVLATGATETEVLVFETPVNLPGETPGLHWLNLPGATLAGAYVGADDGRSSQVFAIDRRADGAFDLLDQSIVHGSSGDATIETRATLGASGGIRSLLTSVKGVLGTLFERPDAATAINIGQVFGSTVGRYLANGNQALGVVTGAFVGAVALNVGQFLAARSGTQIPIGLPENGAYAVGQSAASVFSDFTNELRNFTTGAAIGSVSSYLSLELGEALGLEGFGAELFANGTGTLIGHTLNNLVANSNAFSGIGLKSEAWFKSNGSLNNVGWTAIANAFGAFIGAKLGSLVVQPQTQAGAILGSLGAAVGAGVYGAKIGSAIGSVIPGLGTAIGAFVGFVIGTLVGNLFGRKAPRAPTANAETVLQVPNARYELGAAAQSNAGNLDLVRSMGMAARDTLNGLIETVTRGDANAKVANAWSPTQVYGHTGGQLWVKLGGQSATAQNVSSADEAVDKGVLWALPATQIIGGDLFLKRALYNQVRHPGQAPNIAALSGDLQVAEDYAFYVQNRAVIDALIAEPYNSMTQAQKDFYNVNKAFITRALAKTGVSLTGADLTFYQQNQAMVDSIASSLNLTQFAAAWIITLQRAAELELNRTAVSDFYGGAKGFIDSLGVSIAGASIDYETVSFNMSGSDLRIGYAPVGAGASANLVRGGDLSEGVAPASTLWTGGGVAYGFAVETIDDASALTARKSVGEIPSWGGGYAWGGDVSIGGGDRVNGGHTVTPGETLGFAFETKRLAAGLSIIGTVAFWDAAGNWLGQSADMWANGDGWIRLSATAVAPAGAAYATVRAFSLRADGNASGVFDFAVRNLQLHRLPSGGSVPNWAGAPYETWVEANFLADADYSSIWSAQERSRSNYFNWSTMAGAAHYDDAWTVQEWVSPGTGYWDDWGGWNPDPDVLTEVTYEGGADIAIGTSYADYFNGRSGDDWLDGKAADDIIDGGSGNDVLLGASGDDWLVGGAGNDYIAGGAGTDYVFQWIGVSRDGGGLWGGAGDDTLVGGAGQDSLVGEDGDDLFIVDQEAGVWDWYDGQGGSDTASFERFTTAVSFDLAARAGWSWAPDARYGGANYGSWNDGFSSIENITLSNQADFVWGDEIANVLRGLAGDDILHGKEGDDTLEGGAGADQLFGESGADTASYRHSKSAVWVDLTGTPPSGGGAPVPEAFGGDAEGDTFSSVENLSGSAFADTLKGDANANRLTGLKGDDWFVATAGADIFDGGEGFDTLDYSEMTSAAGVDLQGGSFWYSAAGQSAISIEHLVGTAYNDSLNGTSADETFTGGKGNDYLNGRGGTDTYVFNLGDGVDSIDETSDGANSVVFGEGVDWSKFAIGWSGATLYLYVRGTSDQMSLNGSMINWNHKIKSIDMAGAGAIDINPVNWLVNGTDNGEILAGGSRDWVMAYGGDDTIAGAPNYAWEINQNLIFGGRGNDAIYTSVGDDQFVYERGDGVDTITDAGGADTLVFGPTVAAEDVIFKVVGRDLYIGARDLSNAALDASQVADRVRIVDGGVRVRYEQGGTPSDPNTIEYVIAGGASIDLLKLDIDWTIEESWGGGYYPPVVFDLAGDGLDLISVDRSEVVVQGAPGSPLMRTGWVDGQDGMLAIDRNGDGAITRMSEISFLKEKPGATTDLEGLAGLDSNADGVLNAKDARWSELKLWRDVNQNGVGYRNEVVSLDAAGIVAIELKLTPTGFDMRNPRDNAVLNSAVFHWADGRTGTVYDVALARKLAHIEGGISGAPQAGWKDPGDDGELGRATGVNGRAAVLTRVAVGGVAPAQNLLFTRSAAADGLAPLPAVVRKKNTLEELAADLAKGPVALSAGKVLPIVIDLEGDGLTLVDASRSSVAHDVDQDGWTDKVGWVGAAEGILGLDRDGDGRIGSLAEISFVGDRAGAVTDLEGLAAFDTDGDLQLTASDAAFGAFLIWRDANGDGRSNEDELSTLAAAGVVSIGLQIFDKASYQSGGVANAVLGSNIITLASGEVRTGYDVGLGSISGLALAAASQAVDADVLASAPDTVKHARPILAPWALGAGARRILMRGDESEAWTFPTSDFGGEVPISSDVSPGRNRPFSGAGLTGPDEAGAVADRPRAGGNGRDLDVSQSAEPLDAAPFDDAAPRRAASRPRRWWSAGAESGSPSGSRDLTGLMAMLESQSMQTAPAEDEGRGSDRQIPVDNGAFAGARDRFIQAMAVFRRDRGAEARRPSLARQEDSEALVATPTRWRADRLKA